MKKSFRFHPQVELVDAEEYTNEEIRTLGLPLEINDEASKLVSQKLLSESYDLSPDYMLAQEKLIQELK